MKIYVKKYSKTPTITRDCNHHLNKFHIFNCLICVNCYDLFMIHR
jgi:hypothetical protein